MNNQFEVILSFDNDARFAKGEIDLFQTQMLSYLANLEVWDENTHAPQKIMEHISSVNTHINGKPVLLITGLTNYELTDELLDGIRGEATLRLVQKPVLVDRHGEITMTKGGIEFLNAKTRKALMGQHAAD